MDKQLTYVKVLRFYTDSWWADLTTGNASTKERGKTIDYREGERGLRYILHVVYTGRLYTGKGVQTRRRVGDKGLDLAGKTLVLWNSSAGWRREGHTCLDWLAQR